MFGRFAQGFRAFDDVELGGSGACASYDVAHHFDARHLLERRSFAPDDFQRSDADQVALKGMPRLDPELMRDRAGGSSRRRIRKIGFPKLIERLTCLSYSTPQQ